MNSYILDRFDSLHVVALCQCHLPFAMIYNFQVIILRNSVESEHLLSDGPAVQEQAFPADYAMSAALSDADLANLLMSSPLYRKLGEIKRTMEDGTLPQRKRGEGKKSAL